MCGCDARRVESASPAASASGSAAGAGKVVFKVGWTRQPDNLNPFIGFESPAFEMWYLTYDSLVGYDPATLSPMKGENSTGLATDWSVSADGLTWTFKLRHNAKWSDGVPLTAKDVAFTYNYIVKNPDYTSNLTAYTNLITQGHRARRLHGAVRVLQAQAGHDPPLGAHPARAHLVQDRPEVAEGVHEQPAVRGLRPVHVRRVEEEQLRPSRGQPHLVGPEATITDIYFTYYTNGDTMLQDIKAGTIDAAENLVPTQVKQLQSTPTSRPAPSPRTRSTNWPSTATRGPARATPCSRT